jgi:hypothetical protein
VRDDDGRKLGPFVEVVKELHTERRLTKSEAFFGYLD